MLKERKRKARAHSKTWRAGHTDETIEEIQVKQMMGMKKDSCLSHPLQQITVTLDADKDRRDNAFVKMMKTIGAES